MLALVSTPSFLLLVDLDSRHIMPVEQRRPEYYGISWFPGRPELVLSHSGIDNATLVDIGTYAQSEVGWLSIGEASTELFLSQPHQILCASDDRIVCTNTGRNCVTIVDPRKPGHYHEVRLSLGRWDRLSSQDVGGDHLNAVFERSGRLHVLAHGFDKGSTVAMFSYPDMELIARKSIRGRSGLHNLWMTADGQLISCHSEAGALLDVDGDEVLWEAGTQVYIRGLAVTGDVVVLGETQRTVRGHRRSSMGGLWILDRRSWRAIDYLSLGPFGGVHEVRLLDVPDEAHHNHVFLGLPRLAACDLGADLARQRLASAAAAHVARGCWRGYDLVFGAPETDDMGFRVASPEDLCLAVRAKAAPNPEVAFDYALHREGQHSNVAAVVDYRGSGADTQMTALLLQAASTGAVSSVWRHDGKNWAHLTGAGRGDLPLQGRACLRPVPTGLALMVDGTPVLSVPAAQPVAADGVRGIRWIGARVRPASPED